MKKLLFKKKKVQGPPSTEILPIGAVPGILPQDSEPTNPSTKRIPPQPPATPWKLFLLFAQITTVTLGGGYVIVPVMGGALEKKGWMSEERFYDIFARAQLFPGPFALSTALLVGADLCGFWGAFAAFWAVLLPPFVVIVGVSKLLLTYQDVPQVQAFLQGAGAVVPGVIAAMIWKNLTRFPWRIHRLIALSILTVLLILLPAYSIYLLVGALPLLYWWEGLWKSSK